MSPATIFKQYTQAACSHVHERSIRPSIRAELEAHLEEKAEFLQHSGLSAEAAARRAVQEMGSADELGGRLAQAYRPASLTVYAAVVLLYACLGFSAMFLVNRGITGGGVGLLPQPFALSPGHLAVRAAVSFGVIFISWGLACFLNYGLLLRRAFGAALLGLSLALAAALLSLLPGSASVSIAHWLFSFGYFVLCLLSAYVKGGRWSLPILWGGGLLLCAGYAAFTQHAGALTLFLLTLCLVSLLAFLKRKAAFSLKGVTALALPALLLCAALLFGPAAAHGAPAAASVGYWSPGYNSTLSRQLLSHASLRGPAQFSAEEYRRLILQRYDLQSYQTLFQNGPHTPAYQSYQAERDALLDAPSHQYLQNLLPEHVQQDYLFLYIALRYGLVPAGVLVCAMGLLLFFLLIRAATCHQPTAFYLATGCASFLLLQFLLYCLENLGLAPGLSTGLPFVSWGRASLSASLGELFVLFSCLRFDFSIDEIEYLAPLPNKVKG
ncbi:permease prefix domain 1-containing protein [Allofournierella sp.]|uniref:permease prefix domain 1-containing protein n=1 Tax=Allofournierella sp. TaxID=1940256 RepID=UPI003AB4E730